MIGYQAGAGPKAGKEQDGALYYARSLSADIQNVTQHVTQNDIPACLDMTTN
jgi:hypothetical protein